MLVAEEPIVDDIDVLDVVFFDLFLNRVEHRFGDVEGDHPITVPGDGELAIEEAYALAGESMARNLASEDAAGSFGENSVEVGEGIEKKQENFAEEVMKQVKDSAGG